MNTPAVDLRGARSDPRPADEHERDELDFARWYRALQRQSPGRRAAILTGLAVCLAVLYSLGAMLPFWFLTSPEAGAAFFPSAGVTLAYLCLSPPRLWPLWLTVVGLAEIGVDLHNGLSLTLSIGFAVANVVEPLVGAAAIRTVSFGPSSTLRTRLVTFGLFGVVFGPAVGGAIGATVSTIWGDAASWAPIAARWWLGDALGVLVIATPLLAWAARRSPFDSRASGVEMTAMVALAIGIMVVPAIQWQHPMIYAVLPVLMWAAMRGGTRAVGLAGVGVALAADWAAVTGRTHELLAPGPSQEVLVFVQVFLAVTLLAALTLAVEVADRRRVEQAIRTAELQRIVAERVAFEMAAAERQSLARDTHDIVGHALNIVLLQAGAARRALPNDTPLALDCLESIELVGRKAFGDLDIALMRIDPPPSDPSACGLDGVPSLVEEMRRVGMRVDLDVEGDGHGISTIVDRSAYRVIQEALTNVAKHAPGAGVTVTISYAGDTVRVSVEDDGLGDSTHVSAPNGRQGRGLAGMQGRVAVLSGRLVAGPRPHGGFAVHAEIPMAGVAP